MEVEKRDVPDFDEESISDDDYYKEEKNDQTNQFEEEFLKFMNKKKPDQPKTLGDLIAEKIKERREQLNRDLDQDNPGKRVDKSILDLYREIGVIMSKYTSGKLPKAFKVIIKFERLLLFILFGWINSLTNLLPFRSFHRLQTGNSFCS